MKIMLRVDFRFLFIFLYILMSNLNYFFALKLYKFLIIENIFLYFQRILLHCIILIYRKSINFNL